MVSHYVVAPNEHVATSRADLGSGVLTSLQLTADDVTLTLDVVSVSDRSGQRETRTAEDVLFVVRGAGTLVSPQGRWPLVPQCAAHIPPGSSYRIEPDPQAGDLVMVRVAVAAPDLAVAGSTSGSTAPTVRRIEDCRTGTATGGRDFQVLLDSAVGFASGTLFVGNVPPGPAAPVHYHTYDEVIYLLDGSGVLHIDGEHTPIVPGSCYRLPARTLHQIANTGTSTMRELGVFVPSGSPNAAYLPDGRAAVAGVPDDPVGVAAHLAGPGAIAQAQ